jgi:hypothetical protein
MTTPYENQLLGAFLYALGYQGGRRRTAPVAANLLQQTPLDQVFGDLVVGATRCLALEFKRNERALADERRKWPEGSLRAAWADSNVRHVSASAHLVVYAEPTASGVELRGSPYMFCMLPPLPRPVHLSMSSMIEAIHGEPDAPGLALGMPPDALLQYLHRLLEYKRRSSGGRAGAEAAWLAVVQKGDSFQLVTASSLDHLLEPTRDRDLQSEQHEHDRRPVRDDYDLGM